MLLLVHHLEMCASIGSHVSYAQNEIAYNLHPMLCTSDAVIAWTQVTLFLPLGVRLWLKKNNNKKKLTTCCNVENKHKNALPPKLRPSCPQTTAASVLSQWSSHTVPQMPPKQISTLPNVSFTDTLPPTSLMAVSLHSAKCPMSRNNFLKCWHLSVNKCLEPVWSCILPYSNAACPGCINGSQLSSFSFLCSEKQSIPTTIINSTLLLPSGINQEV